MTSLVLAALDDAGPRPWIWAVVAGLVLGGVLVAHAGLMIARAFPADTRDAAWSAIRNRPRLAVGGAVIALWTIVYGLYSLAYPSAGASPADAVASSRGASVAGNRAPLSARGPALSAGDIAFDTGAVPADSALGGAGSSTPPTSGGGSDAPSGGGGNPPAPCSVAAQAQAVRDAQVAVETLTGQPLGADGGAVVEALAGCKDPTNTALSLLGPIDKLLADAGLTEPLPLPTLPGLPAFAVPEPIAAPLRATVFDACGQLLREIYTVAVVAPVVRIEYDDVIAIGEYVSTACQAFAAQGAA